MAQGYDFNYSVTDELKAHYDKIRQDRDWDWATLADNLERDSATDPATAGIVAWCREEANRSDGDKSARGKHEGVEKRG